MLEQREISDLKRLSDDVKAAVKNLNHCLAEANRAGLHCSIDTTTHRDVGDKTDRVIVSSSVKMEL